MRYFHVVAHTVRSARSLVDPPFANWLWRRLESAFPNAIAGGLMPDHTHVVTPGESEAEVRWSMAAVIAGARRSALGQGVRWDAVPPADEIAPDKLARHVRYVALNPCRAGLVRDPLSWVWTTHRDVVGAVAEPWVTVPRLCGALRQRVQGFAERQHAYVSGDPTASVSGTAFPVAALPSELPLVPLGELIAAAAAAHRREAAHVRKRSPVRATFVDLARDAGWRDAAVVARVAGITPTAVRWRWRLGIAPPAAAWLCLGDARLLGATHRLVIFPQSKKEAGIAPPSASNVRLTKTHRRWSAPLRH